jgi:hypothetical protein
MSGLLDGLELANVPDDVLSNASSDASDEEMFIAENPPEVIDLDEALLVLPEDEDGQGEPAEAAPSEANPAAPEAAAPVVAAAVPPMDRNAQIQGVIERAAQKVAERKAKGREQLTLQQKLAIIKYAETKNKRQAEIIFKVDKSLVKRYCKKKAALLAQVNFIAEGWGITASLRAHRLWQSGRTVANGRKGNALLVGA